MNLAVIGAGYVGLVSGVCFAELGNKVICVDIDGSKIEKLNNNIMPIYEPGLREMCSQNRSEGKIEFTTNLKYAVENSDIIFIAVGTPPMPDGQADLTYVKNVANDVAEYMNGYKIIVNKSTVPVGTQKLMTRIIKKSQKLKYEFDVVSNPEFLREGTAIYDTMHADRVVIGAESNEAAKIMEELHKPLNAPIMITDPESAELIKYASNAFLATKISFINEIANVCELVGANVEEVAKGMGFDKRISNHFLKAGIGYGGACFPKDTSALLKIAEKVGYEFRTVRSTIEVNKMQKVKVVEKLYKALDTLKGKSIGILGLSFKPNTDDLRGAPSIQIIKEILNAGGMIKAYDPAAMEGARKIIGSIQYVDSPYDAVKECDAVILVTEWDEFRKLDMIRVKNIMNDNIFIDGRNIFNYDTMTKLGFEYYCIGKRDTEYFRNNMSEVAATTERK